MNPRINVIIVAYRSEAFLPRLREDLEAFTRGPISCEIWDNTGIQENLARIKNRIGAQGDAPYILFANADIALTPEWDDRLVGFLGRHQELGAALPLPLSDERYGFLWKHIVPPSTFEKGKIPAQDEMRKIGDTLCGKTGFNTHDTAQHFCAFFSLLIRRKVWERLHGFDERFRFLGSDRDLQIRMEKTLGLGVGSPHSCGFFHGSAASINEAESRGELSFKAEWKYRSEILKALEQGTMKRWHDLSDSERFEIRTNPSYARIPCR